MIPDITFITESFRNFNALIFDDSLPVPKFSLIRARSFRGKIVYRIIKKGFKTVNDNFELRISISFDLPENEWEDVVIHEMIHLYIASKGITDSSSHGSEFRKMMHSINQKFHRNINISAKIPIEKKDEINADRRVKAHYVCIARFSDGRLGVAPVAKTRILKLWDHFQNFPKVVSLKWIGSIDPWFNTLPHVQNPKLFLVKEPDLLNHLKGGKILERTGNIIKVVNRQCYPDELLP